MWTAIAGICTLLLAVFTWWVKTNDSGKKKKESDQKEIKDAVSSGDVSSIHAWIDRLRK